MAPITKVLESRTRINDSFGSIESYLHLANYYQNKDCQKSKKNALQAYSIATKYKKYCLSGKLPRECSSYTHGNRLIEKQPPQLVYVGADVLNGKVLLWKGNELLKNFMSSNKEFYLSINDLEHTIIEKIEKYLIN